VEETAGAALSFDEQAKVLAGAVGSFKIDHPEERARVVALVEEAVRHIRRVGPQRAFDDFDDRNGAFVQGEYYIAAYDVNGTRTAVGLAPFRRGDRARPIWWRGLEPVIAKGRGWVDYPHISPDTREIQWKSTYIERVDDHIVLCGFYRGQYEIERVVEAERSQDLLKEFLENELKRPALAHR
jgi:hypothetical protein